ncbi:MAG: Clp protease ClpP [Phycisphaeraceae bacterium]|nr:Clp protease ClpP [Phycisphaeraceae bacterium]
MTARKRTKAGVVPANFDVRNLGNGKAAIYIYDDIGPSWAGMIGAETVRDELADLGSVAEIDLHINSRGGSVAEATAIYNIIKGHTAKVVAWIDGIAASSAGWVAMAGDVVKIAENGYLMLHDPTNLVSGDAEELRKAADVLDQTKGSIARTFASRTGVSQGVIENMMTSETWLVGSDAVSQGFADELSPNKAINCSGDFDCFTNTPTSARRLAGQRNRAGLNAADTILANEMAEITAPRSEQEADQQLIDRMNTLMV